MNCGVEIPEAYRRWEMIAPATEADPLDELRVVPSNAAAVDALPARTLPLPDGAILVKLAWKRVRSPHCAPASIWTVVAALGTQSYGQPAPA